ncbi:MAG: helix-turn-helix domain-containing protein [Candidatus Auribacterota bacterium]|nr:helix-turn-helix domain-containing protein [Candidatus Auribacterota bacterium]
MGRALRIEYPGAFYHITSRGNQSQPIYYIDADRRHFLNILLEAIDKYSVRIHSYVCMTTHYHILLETPLGNLSRCMHFVNVSYTNYFNTRHDRIGHVLHGRYDARLIQKERYLVNVSRYIHLNPVRAGMVKSPQEYPWSSYKDFISHGDSLVCTSEVLSMFSRDKKKAIKLYRQFVEDVKEGADINPFTEMKAGTILGDDVFVEKVLSSFEEKSVSKEMPAYRQLLMNPEPDGIIEIVAEYFGVDIDSILKRTRNNLPRKIAVYLAYKYSDCTLRQLGDIFGGITYAACGKMKKKIEEERQTDQRLDQIIIDIIALISKA